LTLTPFWQVRINVTQAPKPFVPNPFDENALLEWQEPLTMRTFIASKRPNKKKNQYYREVYQSFLS
jgi:hypothetical protein